MKLINLFRAVIFALILTLTLVKTPSKAEAASSATIPGPAITTNMQTPNGDFYYASAYYTEAKELSAATYTGTIAVYGAGSDLSKKTVHYEYDENGKLVRRYGVE